jgi:hypothetical protein
VRPGYCQRSCRAATSGYDRISPRKVNEELCVGSRMLFGAIVITMLVLLGVVIFALFFSNSL